MASVKLAIEQVPEVLWMMRKELARGLRNMAKLEDDVTVQSRLLLMADLFEAGVKVEG